MTTTSLRKFITFLNAKEIGNELRKKGVRFEYNLKKDDSISIRTRTQQRYHGDVSAEQLAEILRAEQQENIYDEPADKVIFSHGISSSKYQSLPEYYEKSIYPATVKPNIAMLKLWVVDVKLNGKTDLELLTELYGDEDVPNVEYNPTKIANRFDHLVDSIAYKISRKIWYVGRRPSSMTDLEWNEKTKNMRPHEGTYGGGDKWKNFKYNSSYQYTSGVF